MKLQTNWQPTINNPTKSAIATSLRTAPLGDSSFAVLEREPGYYIQAAVDGDAAYLLEFHEGGIENHFRCTQVVELEKVIHAFQNYSTGKDDWKTMFYWRKFMFYQGEPKKERFRSLLGGNQHRKVISALELLIVMLVAGLFFMPSSGFLPVLSNLAALAPIFLGILAVIFFQFPGGVLESQ